jgi:uncharacterized membrane protein
MIGREVDIFDLDSRDSEKSLARMFFPRIFIGFLVLIGIVIALLVISNQVQAGDYGVKVQYGTPANGIGNVTSAVDFEYTVDIINNGTSNPGEDINFTVELDPISVAAGWTVTPSGTTIIPNLLMGSGNKVTEIVTVRAPIDAHFGDSAVINITVDVIGHKGEVGCLDSLQLRASVDRDYGVLMTTAADIKTGDPGEEISFEIKVTNQGNLNDTFSFSATGLETGEWSVADVTLEPQEFIYVYYNITIDPDHNTSDILITLNVSSEGDTSGITSDTLDIIIHVNPRYKVKLGDNGGNRKNGYIGITTQFNLTVKNEGTAIDTFELIADRPGGFQVTFSNITIEVESVVVDPPNSIKVVYVWIDLRPSPPVLVGEYYINITATSLNDENATDTYSFIVDVQPDYGVTSFSPTASAQVDPGGTVEIIGIEITNDGNFEDTYRVTLSNLPPGWSSISIPDITLAPGESAFIDLPIITSSNTPAGAYWFNFTVRSLSEMYIKSTQTILIEINQVYDVELPSSVSSKNVNVDILN